MKISLLLFTCWIGYCASLSGQPYWEKYFGTEHEDVGFKVAISNDNAMVVLAYYDTGCFGGECPYLFKLDMEGNVLWEKSYTDSTNIRIGDMIVNTDNEILITGHKFLSGDSTTSVYLTTVSPSGEVVSTRYYGTPEQNEGGQTIISTSDGYLIGGYQFPNAQFRSDDPYLLKLDKNQDTVWTKTIKYSPLLSVFSIAASAQDHHIILLDGGEGGAWDNFFQVLKISKQGEEVWRYEFEGAGIFCYGLNLEASSTGGYFIGGTIDSTSTNDKQNVFTAKINEQGTMDYFKTIEESQYIQYFDDGVATNDGGYIAVGYDLERNPRQLFMLKVNESGAMQWKKHFGGNSDSRGHAIAECNAIEGFALTGTIGGGFNSSPDVYVLKTNREGGFTVLNTRESQEKQDLLSLFPNPASDHFSLSGSVSDQSGAIRLQLYDLSGAAVAEYPIRGKTIPIDRYRLAAGLYIYKITDHNGRISSGKVVIH